VTITITETISDLPQVPAVYVLFGVAASRDPLLPASGYPAYVGVASRLKQRIQQHLVRRDSSVVTGVTAVGLNPEKIREMSWWEHPRFKDSVNRQAGEIVAFHYFEPALRSRGELSREARSLAKQPEFRRQMEALFEGEPSGILRLASLDDAFRRIEELELRLDAVEARLHDGHPRGPRATTHRQGPTGN
jgi:hypothetical protein